MLVKLTEMKGKPIWINPVHVRAVRAKSKHTEIVIPHNSAMGQSVVKVKEPAEEVVDMLNAAMPDLLSLLPIEDDRRQGGSAAATTLMG